MESVVTPFMPHKQHDEQAARQPDRQAGYVDGRVNLVFPQDAQSDLDVVSEHWVWTELLGLSLCFPQWTGAQCNLSKSPDRS
jgi:hypothetical protein